MVFYQCRLIPISFKMLLCMQDNRSVLSLIGGRHLFRAVTFVHASSFEKETNFQIRIADNVTWMLDICQADKKNG